MKSETYYDKTQGCEPHRGEADGFGGCPPDER